LLRFFRAMTPQRRTALVSVLAACALIALKLAAGIPSHSLGLFSEAAHSGTDLIAALLTFVAVGVSGRPADRSHAYGHGKAEHLAALGEAAILVAASLLIVWRAVAHLIGTSPVRVHAAWYTLAVIIVVIVVDLSRTLVSWRAARRYGSFALQSNALHFGSDLAGSSAVLVGLLLLRAGWREADSAAALFVAVLVFLAAGRLMRRNVDVLMDRVPADAEAAARLAIAGLEPPVQLRRLRMRQAAGRHFADVVIGVPPGAVVSQGHAAADAVEAAVQRALPESDVVVHVEPQEDEPAVRERALAAAQRVPSVREIHNLSVIDVAGGSEVSLHLKLPGELALDEAHTVASQVEAAIKEALPEVRSVQTHLEPLSEAAEGRRPAEADVEPDAQAVLRIVADATGRAPRELRFLRTDEGLVAFLTLGLDGASTLAEAHGRASEIEERIRRERPEIADVIVHTEP
jgi:cation diffusion facilitator family transporter